MRVIGVYLLAEPWEQCGDSRLSCRGFDILSFSAAPVSSTGERRDWIVCELSPFVKAMNGAPDAPETFLASFHVM